MTNVNTPTKLITIKTTFAKNNNLPVQFFAKELHRTQKAIYVFGHNTDAAIKVDSWLPLSVIAEIVETQVVINIPPEHSIFKKPNKPIFKKATRIIHDESDRIKIEFTFDRDILDAVKTIQGRRYYNNGEHKYWLSPLTLDAIKVLQDNGFSLDSLLTDFLQSNINIERFLAGLKKPLYPYQEQGVKFIEAKNGRVLLADEMGLGKTAQSLTWLRFHPDRLPVVVVVPASLKLNWERECHLWLHEPNVQILSGTKQCDITGDIIIINYEILAKWLPTLMALNPKVLILDEVHKIKNPKTSRAKAVKEMAESIPYILAISGTPIVNNIKEIYNIIKILTVSSSMIYSIYKKLSRYSFISGEGTKSAYKEIHSTLTWLMLRRKKADVLQDLPDKVRTVVPIEIDNRATYSESEADFINWIDSVNWLKRVKGDNGEALVRITKLKKMAIDGKMPQILEWINTYLESNEKIVVFARHRHVISRLMSELSEYKPVKIDGSTSLINRQQAVDVFQSDDNCRVFIGNIIAAGVGLTLTVASTVLFTELDWTPSAHDQAEDRCHRIGQKNNVNVYYLLAPNTIEMKIIDIIDEKRKMIDAVIDDAETEEAAMLTLLLEKYRK